MPRARSKILYSSFKIPFYKFARPPCKPVRAKRGELGLTGIRLHLQILRILALQILFLQTSLARKFTLSRKLHESRVR
ncbi:hypothetical protein CAMGR0001_0852 [Campylobacter gracilis RM3268]|uniref:Uncharacterized protein n=1 Tax=Campylobacter gracilis RM3268 TaxID=553220 RepID=C8PG59_9BACT|nr:hypothetical protein CAMGR0001_0852 [Campylobacter gracilis RM3268]